MRKFYEIGAKTGLNANELHKAARFGLLGFMAAVLAGLTGCFKTGSPASPATEPAPQASEQAGPVTIQDLVNSIDKSTGSAKSAADGNCGPYPGYPCGTKYYTVSVSDLRENPE